MNYYNLFSYCILWSICISALTLFHEKFNRNSKWLRVPVKKYQPIINKNRCFQCTIYRKTPFVQPVVEKNKSFLLLIMSSYRKDAFERRSVIRATWGNNSLYLPERVTHLFVLGKTCYSIFFYI